jgi:hypothetical protein
MYSTVWRAPCLVICHAEHNLRYGTALSDRADTVAVPCEWSTGPMMYCSCTIAACPHVLQVLVAQPTRTSCRPMMALTSGA